MDRGLNLRLIRTKGESTDDAAPVDHDDPAEDILFLPYRSTNKGKGVQARGYVVKVVTADGSGGTLTPWYRNENPDDTDPWSEGPPITFVSGTLYIEEDTADSAVYFRLTGLGAGGDPAEIWAEEA